jgi:hypothetical protein
MSSPDSWTDLFHPPPDGPIPDGITPQEAAHALWFVGGGGYEPGAFTQHIQHAYSSADPSNKARLLLAFPSIAMAMHIALEMDGGVAKLQLRAEGH